MQDEKQEGPIKDDFDELSRRILQYLQIHPQAKDTMKGIMEWWLLQQTISEGVEKVSRAISWLVTKGYLLEKNIPESGTLYEINANRRDEIAELLGNAGDQDP